jgi:imidazolonepropionase
VSALVIRNASQLVTPAAKGKAFHTGRAMRELAILENGSLIAEDGQITWLGPTSELPAISSSAQVLDASGKTVLPGLVDSHTHLLFAGTRENEFEQRLRGMTYQEIAGGGGGIQSTVKQVRAATKEQLKELARARLKRFLRHGVTTVEVKSGYGLSLADELKCLEAIAELDSEGPLELVPTFLGAHALPPEFARDREGYVSLLVKEMLPEVARRGLAAFCDVFCDIGAFTLAESEHILVHARELSLQVKLHADELSPLGGAELAAQVGAVSADHLLCVTDKGIEALAGSGTVATLLPGTAFFLGLSYAPARRLIEHGVVVALASDCNPGTCPTEDLPLVGTMGCTQMRMLPSEVLTALTLNAAAALGRSDRLGSLEVGKQADLVLCSIPSYQHLFYHFGVDHVWCVVKRGRVVYMA